MNFELARQNMVERQLREGAVMDERTLEVMAELPRERFLPPSHAALAYADIPTPLPCEQRTMTPREEGLLLQAIDLQPHEHILEIGTGSGFLSACMSQLAQQIDSLEIHRELAAQAATTLRELGCNNVTVRTANAWQHHSTVLYDAIVLTGSLPNYTPRFERWVKEGGRIFAVVGQAPVMTAQLICPNADTENGPSIRRLFELELDPLLRTGQLH